MKKKLIIVSYIFICICIIATTVFATFNYQTRIVPLIEYTGTGDAKYITVDEETTAIPIVKDGEIKVRLRIDGFDNPETAGVKKVEGYLNYNENIFEEITMMNTRLAISGFPKDSLTYDTIHKKLTVEYENSMKECIITMFFKLKENVSLGTYTNAIRYDNFVITTADSQTDEFSLTRNVEVTNTIANRNDLKYLDESENIIENFVPSDIDSPNKTPDENLIDGNIIDENNIIEEPNTLNENIANTSNTNVPTPSNPGTGSSGDSTISTARMPNAGAEKIVLALIAIIIVSLIFYSKYNKYKGV